MIISLFSRFWRIEYYESSQWCLELMIIILFGNVNIYDNITFMKCWQIFIARAKDGNWILVLLYFDEEIRRTVVICILVRLLYC